MSKLNIHPINEKLASSAGSLIYVPLVSFFVALLLYLEWRWPWRPAQKQWREGLGGDALFAFMNAFVLGPLIILFWSYAFTEAPYLGDNPLAFAGAWPLWSQLLVGIIGMDFIQWTIHNALHRVPLLWKIHKVHHSVVNGEMDFWVSLRFHWGEQILYMSVQAILFLSLGFSSWVILIHGLLVLIFGFFNHANFELGKGPLRYVLNTSKMHIWHHDAEAQKPQNLGVIFSSWDFIFGTAYSPEASPRLLGFPGVEAFPKNFLRRFLWPF